MENKSDLDFFKSHGSLNQQTDLIEKHPQVIYDRILNLPEKKSDQLKIEWKKMPSLPTNLQECGLGVLDEYLVYFCGYCASGTKGKGQRGFYRSCYAFNFKNQSWEKLPDFPSQGRQGLRTVVIDNEIYAWGGWTYQPMDLNLIKNIPESQWPAKKGYQAFHDGYKLSPPSSNNQNNNQNNQNKWTWTKLPDLPDGGRSNFNLCHEGKMIYYGFGGLPINGQMQTEQKHNHLYLLDTTQLTPINLTQNQTDQLKWVRLSNQPCQGTSRINSAMTIYKNQIYILGGTHANSDWKYSDGTIGSRFYHVEDNWKFDLTTKEWIQLIDNPYRTGNWGGGTDQIKYENYMIMMGGAFFPQAKGFDNQQIEIQRTKPCGCQVSHCKHYNVFLEQIIVYDLDQNQFDCLESKLPGLLNQGIMKIVGNQIHLIGGESYGFKFQGEQFPKAHLDLHLVGTIQKRV